MSKNSKTFSTIPFKSTKTDGLVVQVINPRTCQGTFSEVFKTNDFGEHRKVTWLLDTVHHGDLVVIASLVNIIFNNIEINLIQIYFYIENCIA